MVGRNAFKSPNSNKTVGDVIYLTQAYPAPRPAEDGGVDGSEHQNLQAVVPGAYDLKRGEPGWSPGPGKATNHQYTKHKGKQDHMTGGPNANYIQPGIRRGPRSRRPDPLPEHMQDPSKFRHSKSKSQVSNYDHAGQAYKSMQAPPVLNNAARRLPQNPQALPKGVPNR